MARVWRLSSEEEAEEGEGEGEGEEAEEEKARNNSAFITAQRTLKTE